MSVALGAAGEMFAGSCRAVEALGGTEKVFRAIKYTFKVSAGVDGLLTSFDMLAFGIGIFDNNNPLVTANRKLHSSKAYNFMQFTVSAVAAFSGGAYARSLQGPPKCFVAGTLVHLQIHGEEVITTSDHPFYVNGCGFLNAGELYVGAKMVIANGEIHQVERMSIEVAKDPQKVYNFQVEDFHTYHVGAEGVLVHNASEEYGGGVSKPQVGVSESGSGTKTLYDNQSPKTGADWNDYFINKYGQDNVHWNLNSVDDIWSDPTRMVGYSENEMASVLGGGWTRGAYGSKGDGWKFMKDDISVFYHPSGGKHGGAYYGISSGSTGKIKVVNPNTYIPLSGDKATIIYH